MKIEEAIKKMKEGKKRKFKQSVDMIIALKNIDLKKPGNKFSKEIILPNGRGKDISIGIISDNSVGNIKGPDLEIMSKDKKKVSEFMKKYEFLLCEAPLMPVVGKFIGRYLAPKGKMPKLLPPNADIEKLTNEMKKSVRVSVRNSLSIQVVIGSEDLEETKIKENAETVIESVKSSLPKGSNNIKNVFIKMTMDKPLKVEF